MLISVLCNLFTLLHVIIKQEEGNAPESKPASSNMVKYYGALPVAVGTGIETVEEAAKVLTQ